MQTELAAKLTPGGLNLICSRLLGPVAKLRRRTCPIPLRANPQRAETVAVGDCRIMNYPGARGRKVARTRIKRLCLLKAVAG